MSPIRSVHGRAPCSTDYVEILDGTEVSLGKYVYKWKNHFFKMKGDIGMA